VGVSANAAVIIMMMNRSKYGSGQKPITLEELLIALAITFVFVALVLLFVDED
jgi:Tfp pilus assembly protein PilW